ncbi:MAG: NAD-dependent epimerase/dehydratase family protein [Rubrivivax sp.]|nr:MAG: NAD-dependent epimerase/dehydratase family protein [Rubrivivax sp.]
MKKIAFVTGGAGFLGRNLITKLLEQGWEVHALVRGRVPSWMQHDSLRIHRGSLLDAGLTAGFIPMRADAVFHVAGATTMWPGDLDVLVRDNVTGTQNLLSAAMQRKVKRVVMTSTLGLFRTDLGPVSEQTDFRPAKERNPYLRTKRMADELLVDAANQGLSAVSMHPSHMLGPFDQAGWIKMFDDAAAGKLKAAPGGRASFSPVEQVAQAHIAAAERAAPAFRYVLGGPTASYLQVFNRIANRVGVKPVTSTVPAPILKTVGQLSNLWSTLTSQRPVMTPGLAEILAGDMVGDSRLAEAHLGYRPIDLEATLDKTFAYWRSNKALSHEGQASLA